MAASRVGRACIYRRHLLELSPFPVEPIRFVAKSKHARRQLPQARGFRSSRTLRRQEQRQKPEEPFNQRAGKAWRDTKIEWKPIPVAVGIGLLGVLTFFKARSRDAVQEGDSDGGGKRVPKRERIRPSGGGWQVQIMSTLPLKAISRIWGKFNELPIPYYLRVPGFKLYGWVFGVDFDEVAEPDLHTYPNLASFFYRTLKPGVRPLDPNPRAVLSPADGKILQFGTIEGGEVEQVKGMTYSLDALLGKATSSTDTSPNPNSPINIFASNTTDQSPKQPSTDADADAKTLSSDEEFANMNGISYTLPNLFSGPHSTPPTQTSDQSLPSQPASEAAVRADLARTTPWWSSNPSAAQNTKLYYYVIYLAPGDYHRFHSPVSWVCTSRRHFAGELYSVSPYLQRTLPGLFTLNERVVLLGRWKYGFFSYTPVGATNVGSIVINFDKELRTNSLTTDTQADREAAAAKERGEAYSGFSEADYSGASRVLGGHALRKGEEMGGFMLGSSIVVVFEAPAEWTWGVEKGEKVKMGSAVGWVEGEEKE
jgi:phosphatidylserine decarboxylase